MGGQHGTPAHVPGQHMSWTDTHCEDIPEHCGAEAGRLRGRAPPRWLYVVANQRGAVGQSARAQNRAAVQTWACVNSIHVAVMVMHYLAALCLELNRS